MVWYGMVWYGMVFLRLMVDNILQVGTRGLY